MALSLCWYFLVAGRTERWWQWRVRYQHSVWNVGSVQPTPGAGPDTGRGGEDDVTRRFNERRDSLADRQMLGLNGRETGKQIRT